MNLIKRVEAAYAEVQALETEYSGQVNAEGLIEADAKLREVLNKAFDTDICTPAFGGANLFTDVGGRTMIEAFLDAFLPILEQDLKEIYPKRQPTAPRPEVQQYLPADTPITRTDAKPIAGLAQPYGAPLPDVSRLTPEQKRELLSRLL